MLIIIGGSGMLFSASETLTRLYQDVLLCGRQAAHYQPILDDYRHARFFKFDFSLQADYERLAELLKKGDVPLTFLIWVHSPYYVYLAQLLLDLNTGIERIYLVKGSNSKPLPNEWMHWDKMIVITLGRHAVEDRWLNDDEICQKVLKVIND